MIADVPTGAWIVWLGAAITWACAVPYIAAAARGTLTPSPSWVSWSVWTATTGLGAGAALAAGSPTGALVPGIAFLRCAATLTAVLVGARRADQELTTRLDWGCLAACMVTGAVWLATGNPVLALIAAIATDGAAAIPTYCNAWRGGETVLNWAGCIAPPLITILILPDRHPATWAYPVYELTLTATMTALILARGATPPVRRPVMLTRYPHLIVRRPDRPDLAVRLSPDHAAHVVALLADMARDTTAELIVMPIGHLRRHEELVYSRALGRH